MVGGAASAGKSPVRLPPRLVVAAPHSGAGKTTVAVGLIAALRASGYKVAPFKVGPDYIDPSFHRLASGRPGRNLDPFLCGEELVTALFAHGAQGAEIAVIEGVMGLFDGAAGRGEVGSTAQVAKLLGAPVVLVVDGRGLARSAAALLHGFRTFDPSLSFAGVVFNRVGSDRHRALLEEACAEAGLPFLGALPRDGGVALPDRHLGLVPAQELSLRAQEAIERVCALVRERVDLARVVAAAAAAEPRTAVPWQPPKGPPHKAIQVAVAVGPAFSFHYQENLELLEAAGAELCPFDPLCEERLPAGAGALLLAGGFPELHAPTLAENSRLREEVAAFAKQGAPIIAECGGLLFLGRELSGQRMCGVLPLSATLGDRPVLGYREATAAADSPYFRSGETVRGHEFHYARTTSEGEEGRPAWRFADGRLEGFVKGSVHASFLHLHWAALPQLAAALVEAAQARCSWS